MKERTIGKQFGGTGRLVPYFLSFVLIVFLLASLVLYGEENLFISFGDPVRVYSTPLLVLTICTYLPLLTTIHYVGSKKFGIRPSPLWLCVFLIFLVLSLISIWLIKGPFKDGNSVFALSMEGKIRYTILTFYVTFGLYYLFAYVPKMIKGVSFFHFAAFLIVVYSLIAIIYSLIAEFPCYLSYFDSQESVMIPMSFYLNRNVYGFTVFIGIAALMFLEAKRPRWWRWPLALGMFFVEFFIMSKSSLLASGIVFIGCFFWNSFRCMRTHPFRSLFFFLLGLFIIGSVIAIPFLHHTGIEKWDNFSSLLYERLSKMFLSSEGSANARLDCFAIAWAAISSSLPSLLLGFGFANWKNAIYAYHGEFLPLDNGFVEDLARGGVIGLFFSILMWIFFFVLILRAMKRRSPYGLPLFFLFFAYLARNFFEASSFLNPNITNVIMYIQLALPLLTLEAEEKNLHEEQAFMDMVVLAPKKETFRSFYGVFALLCSLLSILCVCFSSYFSFERYPFFNEISLSTIVFNVFFSLLLLALAMNLFEKLHPGKGILVILCFILQSSIGFIMPYYIEGIGPLLLSFVPFLVGLIISLGEYPSFACIVKAVIFYFLPIFLFLILTKIFEQYGEALTAYSLTYFNLFILSYYFMVDCFMGAYSPFASFSILWENHISLLASRKEAKNERKYLRYRYKRGRIHS